MVEIKEAAEEDVKILLEFSRKLNEFERKLYPNYRRFELDKEKIEKFFRKRIKREDSVFLIAWANGKPVGMAYAWIVKSFLFFKEEKYGYIGEVWVEEGFRRKGIGRKLVEKIIEWFKSKGIKWIRTDVLSKNKRAFKFYEKLGFKEFQKELEVWLE